MWREASDEKFRSSPPGCARQDDGPPDSSATNARFGQGLQRFYKPSATSSGVGSACCSSPCSGTSPTFPSEPPLRKKAGQMSRVLIVKEPRRDPQPKGRTLSAHVSPDVALAFDAYVASLPEPRPIHRDALRYLIADWLTGHGFLKHRDDPEGANRR